jgi:hypothetical protein
VKVHRQRLQAGPKRERGEWFPVNVFRQDRSKGGLPWLVVTNIGVLLSSRDDFSLFSCHMSLMPGY